jgi:hypothetical protein
MSGLNLSPKVEAFRQACVYIETQDVTTMGEFRRRYVSPWMADEQFLQYVRAYLRKRRMRRKAVMR